MSANYSDFEFITRITRGIARERLFAFRIAEYLDEVPSDRGELNESEIRLAVELSLVESGGGEIKYYDNRVKNLLKGIQLIEKLHADPGKVISELSSNHIITKETIVAAHNIYKIDVLSAVGSVRDFEFWTLFHHVCKAIIFLDTTHEILVSTLGNLSKKIENDLGGGEIYSSVRELASAQPELGLKSVELILIQKKVDAFSFVPVLFEGLSLQLGGGSLLQSVQPFIESEDRELQRVGILSLSLLKSSTDESDNQLVDNISKILDSKFQENDIGTYPSLAQAYGNLMNRLGTAKERLCLISSTDDPQTLSVLAHVLWRGKYESESDKEWVSTILFGLAKVKGEHRGTLNIISYLLADRINNDPEIILEYLDRWVVSDPVKPADIRSFEHLFEQLYAQNRPYFTRIVTRWLIKENLKFQLSLAEILNAFFVSGIKSIELDREALTTFAIPTFEMAVFRTLGFVIHKEHLQTILYSILQQCGESDEVRGLVVSAFVQYVVYNYPSTIDFLKAKEKEANSYEKKAIMEIVNYWQAYTKELKKIGNLDELRGSDERQLAFFKLQNKIFQRGFQKSEESSIFSAVRKIDLKSGGRMFMKTKEGYSEKTKLGLIQSGAEMPRGEYIDPIGQAKLRFLWKTFQIK